MLGREVGIDVGRKEGREKKRGYVYGLEDRKEGKKRGYVY